ncbi:MAG: hypothetical protein ACI4QR_02960, partial [Eubacteriales bacterium]
MNLKIFNKNKNAREQMFRDSVSREESIAELFSDAQTSRSAVEGYWKRMRSYYDGTHETARKTGDFLASVNIPWRPAEICDGYMHVESQVVAKVPDFEFAARNDDAGAMAKTRERIVRYISDINDMERKNAVNERRLN